MIRRVFKARTSRSTIINMNYKVWWSLKNTSQKKNKLNLTQQSLNLTKIVQLSLDRKNFILGKMHQIATPQTNIYLNIGYQQLKLKSVLFNNFESKTIQQSKTVYINSFNNTTFTNTSLLHQFKVKKLYQTYQKYNIYNNLTYTYYLQDHYNYYLQVQSAKKLRFWRLRKKIKLLKLFSYNNKQQQYSNREYFFRIITNRNYYYLQHSHLIYNIVALKI